MNAVNTKPKHTLKSTKLIWITALIVLSILLGTYQNLFSYAALLMSLLVVAFFPSEDAISLLMFLVSFASLFKAAPASQSFLTYLILFFVLWQFFKKREIKTGALIPFLLFVMFVVLQTALNVDVLKTIKFIANLLLLYLVITENAGKNCKKIFLFYIFGILISSLVAAWNLFPNLEEYVGSKGFYYDGEEIDRFKGLYGDPNYYSINVILAFCLTVFLNYKKQIFGITTVVLSAFWITFVGMTQSKSAFLMLFLPLLLLFYSKIKQKRSGAVVLLLCLAVVFFVNLFAGRIEAFRIIMFRFDEASSFATFTTGRTDLWESYTEYLIQNPLVLLFGSGFGAPLLNGYGAHNTYLDLLYCLGITGTVILLAYFSSIFKILPKPKQRNLLNYGGWIGIFIMYAFLSEIFYYDWVFHIILAFLLFQSDVSLDQPASEKRIAE